MSVWSPVVAVNDRQGQYHILGFQQNVIRHEWRRMLLWTELPSPPQIKVPEMLFRCWMNARRRWETTRSPIARSILLLDIGCFIAGWIVAQRRRRWATIHPSMARYAFAGHMYLVHIKSGFGRCSSIAGWMVAQRLRRSAIIQPAMDICCLKPEGWLSMLSTPFSGGEC